MTSAVIRAALKLPKSRNSATITNKAPSVRFFSTVLIVALTSFERSRTTSNFMLGGIVLTISASLSPVAAATARLFSPSSINAVPTTTSSPFSVAAPVRKSPPLLTDATSRTRTGMPSRVAMIEFSISSSDLSRASARTRNASPPRSTKFAPTERLTLPSASERSSKPIP